MFQCIIALNLMSNEFEVQALLVVNNVSVWFGLSRKITIVTRYQQNQYNIYSLSNWYDLTNHANKVAPWNFASLKLLHGTNIRERLK